MAENLVLFYGPNGCSLGSNVLLEWLGVPYMLCRIDKEQHHSADYLTLNRLGLTPMLALGDRLIPENVAVLHHLNALGVAQGEGFVQGTEEFDRMNHALGFIATSLHPAFAPFFHVERFAESAAAQAEVKRVSLGILRTRLAYVDSHLTPAGFLFGRATLVEAFLTGIVRWANDLFDWRSEFPNVASCEERMLREPAVRFALSREQRTEVATTGGFAGEITLSQIAIQKGKK
jgi:glutathione S-transferase